MDDKKNKEVMDFLLSRRSDSARTLVKPAPNKKSLERILIAAARTPDHGRLVPWRFLIFKSEVLRKISKKILHFQDCGDYDPDKIRKIADLFLNAPLIVAVVSSPKDSDRIPVIEQKLSAGAVCLALLNAAHADGWGANWLSGLPAHDKQILQAVFDVEVHEFVAGFIHIGTKTVSPVDRVRPNIKKITSYYQC